MITEDYVSFEIAKLLKENGFDEYCFCVNYPLAQGGHHNIISSNLLNNSTIPFTNEYKFCIYKEDFITIPTLQLVMKWLRENHHLEIYPFHDSIQEYNMWWYRIEKHSKGIGWTEFESGPKYLKYEEAAEAAIKYCLEHLI